MNEGSRIPESIHREKHKDTLDANGVLSLNIIHYYLLLCQGHRGPHKRRVSLFVRNVKKCMGEY